MQLSRLPKVKKYALQTAYCLINGVISMGRRNTRIGPEFVENKSQKRWLGQRSRNVALAGF
jgi:hypothetical protein